jgi:hypothetical protein
MVHALLQDCGTRARTLRDDNRGAVMLTGLFMAFFLVGALWYVIGIGDAIIFRDRMQEATDSAVFSSAAVHAKGMNFISVCNILLLILALIHIVLGLAQDLTIAACLTVLLSLVACPLVPGVVRAFRTGSPALKTAMTVTANVSSAIAIAAPWAGTARGVSIGREYGNQGRIGDVTSLTLGPSNFPGAVGGRGILLGTAAPLGLPVNGEPFNMLCEKIGKDLFSFFDNLIPLPFGSFLNDVVGGAAGAFFKFRYCNDLGSSAGTADMLQRVRGQFRDVNDELRNGTRQTQRRNDRGGDQNGQLGLPGVQDFNPDADQFETTSRGGRRVEGRAVNGWSAWFDPGFDRGWGDPGVLVVEDNAGNGTFAHQVWAVTMNPKYRETNERKVSIAGSIGRNGRAVASDSDQGSGMIGYFAQAEFYYDCDREWRDDECDGDDHNAAFGINWRARLRGLQVPNLLSLLGRIVNGGIRSAIEAGLQRAVSGNPVAAALARSAAGAIAIDTLAGYIEDNVVNPLVTDRLTDSVDDFFNRFQPGLNGSYH